MIQPCFAACLFIIFGATGDLSKRKLIPAIYKLIQDKKIDHFALVGTALEETDKQTLLERSRPFIPSWDAETWEKLSNNFYYYPMNFYHGTQYNNLKNLILEVERSHDLTGNRLLYFATMPQHFPVITKCLLESSLVTKNSMQPWTRLVYEKPFGNDVQTSHSLNTFLRQAFAEEQIYRIDHYLGKELVGNISLARFTNRIFEPLWNNQHIGSVHITISETLGIEQRGAYYDEYGQLKDMVQSHMLQLLALTAMEPPETLTADTIRDAKAAVLRSITIDDVLYGQYEGYTQEPRVAPNSQTDTLVGVRLLINNDRWYGVPFYLTTGKALDKKETSITVVFKKSKCPLTSCPAEPNALIFKITPNDGIYLRLNAKVPGAAYEVAPVRMDFCHSSLFGPNTPEAYEILLADVIRGDQAAFIRADEVESSWRVVEDIIAKGGILHPYTRGSTGPAALKNLYLPAKDKDNE